MFRSNLRPWFGTVFLAGCLALSGRGLWLRFFGESDATESGIDFQLHEEAKSRGIHFVHEGYDELTVPNVAPWIQSFGASVAVADINGDGFMDFYVVRNRVGSLNELYLNDGHGHFVESAESMGLARLNFGDISVRPLFMDCNGDQRPDLFLTSGHCPRVFRQEPNGQFTQVDQGLQYGGCFVAEAAAIFDFSKDGLPDVVLGGINGDGGDGFRTLPTNFVDARNGSELQVLVNDGQCHFRSDSNYLKPNGRFFYHSIGLGDLRGTGSQDLWIATDFNSDKLFLRENNSYQFHPMEGSNSRFGMNSEVIYLDGNDHPYIFVSHSYRLGYVPGGNAFWHYENGRFKDSAIERGLRKCGWAWGGRAMDLNNDGNLDIAVANGFLRGDPKKDYWYSFSVMAGTAEMISSRAGFWPEMSGKNFSGYERDCLYLNRGDGKFIDVAGQVGFDSERFEGRAVAVIDSQNRGVQDLIVINQNAPLYYYHNEILALRHWIGFSVEPLGTVIIVKAGGRTFRRENFSTNAYASQSDPRLHFGLGALETVDSVEVRWPDGRTENLGSMKVDQYHKLVRR